VPTLNGNILLTFINGNVPDIKNSPSEKIIHKFKVCQEKFISHLSCQQKATIDPFYELKETSNNESRYIT